MLQLVRHLPTSLFCDVESRSLLCADDDDPLSAEKVVEMCERVGAGVRQFLGLGRGGDGGREPLVAVV